jgi:hypothetical protein
MALGTFNTVGLGDQPQPDGHLKHKVVDVLVAVYVAGGGEPLSAATMGFSKIVDAIGERNVDGTFCVYDITNSKLKCFATGGAEAGGITGTFRFHVWGY